MSSVTEIKCTHSRRDLLCLNDSLCSGKFAPNTRNRVNEHDGKQSMHLMTSCSDLPTILGILNESSVTKTKIHNKNIANFGLNQIKVKTYRAMAPNICCVPAYIWLVFLCCQGNLLASQKTYIHRVQSFFVVYILKGNQQNCNVHRIGRKVHDRINSRVVPAYIFL